uniref:Uncharacterized protein n=1 Tax=Picea glauca TaxID=3330 RepID=A0A101LWD0_PICGL|nr:hypothetical protein ABT39_MTgene1676 [Picea glauca]
MEIGIEIGRAYIHIWGGRLYSLNARGRSCRISGEVRSVRPPLGEREEIWVGEGEVRRVSAYYTIGGSGELSSVQWDSFFAMVLAGLRPHLLPSQGSFFPGQR